MLLDFEKQNYLAPGFYVQEVDLGPAPVRSAESAVLAIIGYVGDKAPLNPTRLRSLAEYNRHYLDLDKAKKQPPGFLTASITGFFENGGRTAYVVPLVFPAAAPGAGSTTAATPSQPGPGLQVVSWDVPTSGKNQVIVGADKDGLLHVLIFDVAGNKDEPKLPSTQAEAISALKQQLAGLLARPVLTGAEKAKVLAQVTSILGPGVQVVSWEGSGVPTSGKNQVIVGADKDGLLHVLIFDVAGNRAFDMDETKLPSTQKKAISALKQQLAGLLAPQVLTDAEKANVLAQVTSIVDHTPQLVTLLDSALEQLKRLDDVTLVTCPDLFFGMSGMPDAETVRTIQFMLAEHCQSRKNRVAIFDMANEPSTTKVRESVEKLREKLGESSLLSYASAYHPWVTAKPRDGNGTPVPVPPSGHVAGVYARVDRKRGVHKAPANEALLGVTGLASTLTGNDQETLNPEGVNCLRAFPDSGPLVWGARTLEKKDPRLRYINVRRLFCHIEDSLTRSLRWVVFEPNNQVLWAAIRRDVTAYLTARWNEGALLGTSPEQAFYVRCDEETNPREIRDAGYCVVEVGLAPVRPAEFVVLQIGQWEGGTAVAELYLTP